MTGCEGVETNTQQSTVESTVTNTTTVTPQIEVETSDTPTISDTEVTTSTSISTSTTPEEEMTLEEYFQSLGIEYANVSKVNVTEEKIEETGLNVVCLDIEFDKDFTLRKNYILDINDVCTETTLEIRITDADVTPEMTEYMTQGYLTSANMTYKGKENDVTIYTLTDNALNNEIGKAEKGMTKVEITEIVTESKTEIEREMGS